MLQSTPAPSSARPEFLLVSDDGDLADGLRSVLGAQGRIGLTVAAGGIEAASLTLALDAVEVVIVDLDAGRRDELIALQSLIGMIGGHPPVVVVTNTFDEALARWLLQIRVTDFVRKPIEPAELYRTCAKAMGAAATEPPLPARGKEARICTFVPAAGGVGVTTLAIQTALIMLKSGRRERTRTCLVDLDFQNGTCADYLDIEPRLDLNEIGPHPERLDQQLLEIMFSQHASGLTLLAAPNRPAESPTLGLPTVTQLLDLVAARFDNVVIDMPRTWFPWTDSVIAGSDKVYVVTDMTVPGLRLARRVTLAIRDRIDDGTKADVIVNRFEQSLFGTGLRKADVDNALDGMLAGVVPNNYKLVREAIDRGVPLEDVKAANNVVTDLRKIVVPAGGEKAVAPRRAATIGA